ncbi:MAG TPA: GNAT family N-acyltransferase [Steroidobacteraceae bacterium]|nr:GNAT family N-acyltransferase [Steroidobacteraceae bacterium]
MTEQAAGRRDGTERGRLRIPVSDTPTRLRRLALRVLPALARLHRIRDEVRCLGDPFEVAEYALRELRVEVQLGAADLDRIPGEGGVVITANHPFGGLDGLLAIAAIGRRRQDLRILANAELARIAELRALIIPVDPFGGAKAARANVAGMRRALRWAQGGGALLVFPAGEVSHLRLRSASITDPPWSATAARLVRLAGVPVVPLYIAGANSVLFQIAGLVHPRLRTLLLPAELANKSGTRVHARIGAAIAPARYRQIDSDPHLAAYLRLRTYGLKADTEQSLAQPAAGGRAAEPVAAQVEPERVAREIEALPTTSLLASAGNLRVHLAAAKDIPWTLQEVGRLRELTFRAVGEGTGRGADVDLFDDYYEHLVLWDADLRRIAGGYRLGRTDVICRRFGRRGLYTSTLFDYGDLFLGLLGPALELGRSFVRVEYQRSFAALMLLWKGIAEYVARNPRYCRLIGPVSISNDYQPLSRELQVAFLRDRLLDPLTASLRPKRAFRGRLSLRSVGLEPRWPADIDQLSSLVAGLEPDGKGAPVLLRQYLRLGGRVLGFSIDPDFGNALDCLILVDLRKTEPRVLRKYMSESAWARFQQKHRGRGARNGDGDRAA